VLCVFPFELDFYKSHNQRAVFVGHPLAQELSPRTKHAANKIILLMPGSRDNEVRLLLPEMVAATIIMSKQDDELKFKLVLASDVMLEYANHLVGDLNIDVSVGDAHSLIKISDLVLVSSGTATLEVALIGVPMVVVYKLSTLSYLIASNMIKSQFVSLPNVISNKSLVPELIQDNANGTNIAEHALNILSRDNTAIIKEFAIIHSQLSRDSSNESARAVIELINE
jgi:lipid-A-disaccharide synthase